MLADPRMALRTISLVQPVPSGLWLLQDSWWVKACASDFFIWPHACPHHFRRGALALKMEQNLGSVPSGLQIPIHELYLLWLIPPSWKCFCGSTFVNLLSVGPAIFAIRNRLLVPTLNYFLIQLAFLIGRVLQEPSSHPKWGKEKESSWFHLQLLWLVPSFSTCSRCGGDVWNPLYKLKILRLLTQSNLLVCWEYMGSVGLTGSKCSHCKQRELLRLSSSLLISSGFCRFAQLDLIRVLHFY